MPLDLDIGDVVAVFALFLSAFATWKTIRFNKRQESLVKSQDALNKLLLDKGKSEALTEKRADLGTSFIKLGNSKYRFKIWNKGRAAARDVRIEFPEGNDVLFDSEINEKFPLERLEQHQSVELIAAVDMGSKRKQTIRLIWADDVSETNEKITYPTI